MLFEILKEETKEHYNRLLKTDEIFKSADLPTRVLMAQLESKRYYETWEEMLEQSVLGTMERIEYNFMELFRGYDLRNMLPYPNTEEKIIELYLANFKNVEVNSKWEEEQPDLGMYLSRIIHKYYLFLITIHANTSEAVRPGIVKSFSDFIKEFELSKKPRIDDYVEHFLNEREKLD